MRQITRRGTDSHASCVWLMLQTIYPWGTRFGPHVWRFRHKSSRAWGQFGQSDGAVVLGSSLRHRSVGTNPKEDQGFGLDWCLQVDSLTGGRCDVFGVTPDDRVERSVP